MKAFTESDKYDWPLTCDSLVVEVGAYQGQWAVEMIRKYGCRIIAYEPIREFFDRAFSEISTISPKSTVYCMGMAARTIHKQFCVKGEMSGAWADGDRIEVAPAIRVSILYDWSRVNLLALNCEGGEYEILETIIQDGKQSMFENILVQFHNVVPQCVNRMLAIRDALNKTHDCLYDEPWCWAAWRIKHV